MIGNDDAESGGRERVDLVAPGIPEFGETVEQKDDGGVRRAGGDGVEIDRAVVKEQVLERGWHRKGVYAGKNGERTRRSGDGGGFEAVGGDVGGGVGNFGNASFGIVVRDGGVRLGGGFGSESADGLVAASVLGFVESAIGEGENFFVGNIDGRIHIPGESSPADGDGAMKRKVRAFEFERLAGNSGEDAGGESGGFLALAKTGDDEKLFAAPADEYIGIANGGADAGGEINEHLIASVVAEAIVDFFEMVGVDEIENNVAIAAAASGIGSGIGANGLADVAGDSGLEKTAVASGGERIGERHFLEFFIG